MENSNYYWKCPECGEEQKVTSAYFMTDCGCYEKCANCGRRVHCVHPVRPLKKKDEEVTAYEKKEEN
ncbi:MAG: hypothetical protein J6M60_05505 [Clostridia bacterium]|nr:hypothetical protein [Clostridia bacterium]